MKKLLLCALLLVLLPPGAAAEADPGETDGDSIYEMRTTEGVKITSRAGRMFEGDEYISGDNQLYRIVSVDDGARVATAEHLGAEPAATREELMLVSAMAEEERKLVSMYSTHSDESYEPTDGAASLEENAGIYDVGESLKENLEKLGVDVVYSDATHLPHDAGAYRRSRRTAEELLKDSPDALIDIHRDGIPDPEEYETEIDGEETSKVRLLVGRSNPNADANRAFAKELKAAADELYPGLIKDIFVGKGNYNQELYPQSILLEFGTHTIDKERAIAATSNMAEVLDSVLFGGTAKAEGAGEETGAGFTGIWWLIGLAVLGALIYALASTGKFKLIGEKFSRGASELTGGTLGKRPRDKEK